MGKASKDKGRRGELIAARMMSAWWMGNPALLESRADDLPIRRTPMSGGWSKAKGVGGDLVPVFDCAKDFVFSTEVKNREGWSFDGILKDVCWPIHGWWQQCINDAAQSKLVPLLLFTKNFHPWYFSMHISDWKQVRQFTKLPSLLICHKMVFGTIDNLVSIKVDAVKKAFIA